MGLFKKMFGSKNPSKDSLPKGYSLLTVADVRKETNDAVSISFDLTSSNKDDYSFIPGQYITILVVLDGKEHRRSYSICSAPNEPLRIGVKKVDKGIVSTFLTTEVQAGDTLAIAHPEGNFKLTNPKGSFVAFAAGSGITPILSIAKTVQQQGGALSLFYGNRVFDAILFKKELDELSNVTTNYFLSAEEKDGFHSGRLSKENISAQIKADLSLLKADAFFICGPEEMIVAATETLKIFGVSEDKIIYELFTTPVLMQSKTKTVGTGDAFSGVAHVEVILDGETIEFELDSKGKSILTTLVDQGEDAPFSCKGGVCSTCKAKVTEGKATMKLNYSLTDKEVEEGYILTCQAHPVTETLKLTYDE
jgi:ring-1,2-phenylacetyl-CoA epoxidase subunit PaaE